VLLRADRDGRHIVETAYGAHGALQRIPPPGRVDLGSIRVR